MLNVVNRIPRRHLIFFLGTRVDKAIAHLSNQATIQLAAISTAGQLSQDKVLEVFNQKGPGIPTHIWFTVSAGSRNYLKELVLRAWWDDEENPSIEAPLGRFLWLKSVYAATLVAEVVFPGAGQRSLLSEGR